MKSRDNLLSLVLISAFGAASPVLAACQADVDVARSWVEDGGFVQKATLKSRVSSAKPGAYVKVNVELRFSYERSDGWSNGASTSDMITVDTASSSTGMKVFQTRASNCSKAKPCEIKEVEIISVRCYD